MIAPIREPDERPGIVSDTMRRAHRAVAESLLTEGSRPEAPSVVPWQAWLVTAWWVAVAAAWTYCQVANR
jgi:hypothetical protein